MTTQTVRGTPSQMMFLYDGNDSMGNLASTLSYLLSALSPPAEIKCEQLESHHGARVTVGQNDPVIITNGWYYACNTDTGEVTLASITIPIIVDALTTGYTTDQSGDESWATVMSGVQGAPTLSEEQGPVDATDDEPTG